MNDGVVVQAGTPVELFERPKHTFVGHFIGSPGMNVLPATLEGGVARFLGHPVRTATVPKAPPAGARLELGVRPEFVRFAPEGIPVRITKVSDTGRLRVVEARHEEVALKLLVGEGERIPGELGHVAFEPSRTQLYADGWIVT
jgi:glycerol transport system ATP-binding protein